VLLILEWVTTQYTKKDMIGKKIEWVRSTMNGNGNHYEHPTLRGFGRNPRTWHERGLEFGVLSSISTGT